MALVALILAAAHLAAPAAPASAPVVVASHTLEPGHELTRSDLTVAQVPLALAPEGSAADVEDLMGRTLTVAVPEGLVIAPGLLAGDRFAVQPPDGTVVAPLDLAEQVMLRPGDRVDVLASSCEHAGTVLTSAIVVETDPVRTQQPAVGGLDVSPVLVAVPSTDAAALAEVRVNCTLMAVLVP